MRGAEIQIAWAAGLYEGEGSATVSNKSFRLKLGSTDEDVVRKLQAVLGGRVTGPYEARPGHSGKKPHWVWSAYGHEALSAAAKMYFHLGKRRQRKIDSCLAELHEIVQERSLARPCRICGTEFVPDKPRYASRTFYCSKRCKARVSNGYVPAQNPRTRLAA